jgi:hypothetical protein
LSYDNNGIDPADFDSFIEILKNFREETKEQYKGVKIKLFLLPSEMVEMMSNTTIEK